MNEAEREERRQIWLTRVQQFRASGKSVRAWCLEKDVSHDQMYYWLKKFRKGTDQPDASSRFVKMAPEISKDSFAAGVRLRIGDVAIEVSSGFDKQVLGELVQWLQTDAR